MKKKVIEIITKKDDDLTALYCWGLEKGVINKILALVNGLDIEVKQSEVPGLMAIEPPFTEKDIEQDIKEGNVVPVEQTPAAEPKKTTFVVPNALAAMESVCNDDPAIELSIYAKNKDLLNIRNWALKYAVSEDMEMIKKCLQECCNNVFKTALLKYLAQRTIYDAKNGFDKEKYEAAVSDALSAELTEQVREDLLSVYRQSLSIFLRKKGEN